MYIAQFGQSITVVIDKSTNNVCLGRTKYFVSCEARSRVRVWRTLEVLWPETSWPRCSAVTQPDFHCPLHRDYGGSRTRLLSAVWYLGLPLGLWLVLGASTSSIYSYPDSLWFFDVTLWWAVSSLELCLSAYRGDQHGPWGAQREGPQDVQLELECHVSHVDVRTPPSCPPIRPRCI